MQSSECSVGYLKKLYTYFLTTLLYEIMNGIRKEFEEKIVIEKFLFYILGPFMAVITGFNGDPRSDAQVIDMRSSSTGCPSLTPYPNGIYGATGGLIANKLVICGGYDDSTHSACYNFDNHDNQWKFFASLHTARMYFASTTLHDGSLFITGKPFFICLCVLI